jgi:hypothetical protein
MAEVYGLRLIDGRDVAVKARPDQNGREATCVDVQRHLAANGYPCAAPLTGVTISDGRAIHAEQWRPGGAMLRDVGEQTARLFAAPLAAMVALAAGIEVAEPPLPNPEWTRWDHDDRPGPWPHISYLQGYDPDTVPVFVTEAARRIHERLAGVDLPRVLGHADWESQNLRWHDDRPWAVHDWDSLAWLPEAAIAGAASGAFASAESPTLAPIASSAAFLEAYAKARGRPFDDQEIEVAWAASLWPALHNARSEALHGTRPVSLKAVAQQAEERLRRAGA